MELPAETAPAKPQSKGSLLCRPGYLIPGEANRTPQARRRMNLGPDHRPS